MDFEELMDCLRCVGVSLGENQDIPNNFLGVLEETNAKIRKVSETMMLSNETMSGSEIACYERYISSLFMKLLDQNTETVLKLLILIKKKLKRILRAEVDLTTFEKAKKMMKICKRIRVDLINNKDILIRDQTFWTVLYRIMRFEDAFRLRIMSVS